MALVSFLCGEYNLHRFSDALGLVYNLTIPVLKPYQNEKFRMILLESGGTSEVIDTFYILQNR